VRDHLLKMYEMTLGDAKKQVADVPCERFAEVPFPGAKHPGWVLGHLALGGAMGAAHLRHPSDPSPACEGVPEAWMKTCMGEPTTDRGSYGTKDDVLGAYESAHEQLSSALRDAGDDVLNAEFPNPEWRSFFPTLGVMAFYMMAHHEGYHLGQLTQWRRAAGFGPAE
jgi:hypothetical protein